ncbi:MAG: non-homologous end-joining DNA ligase [Nitriliruptorales bacterium]|nr:non-homologous end-joining DNA ligase [Nitriliruptorales bacterium]
MSERTTVEVAGQAVSVSNLDKSLYPEAGFTKAAVIDYYVKVADALLPHLHGRPLTMLRFPDGVDGERFFEKRCPDHRPDFVQTIELGGEGSGRRSGKRTRHCRIDDLPSLVWVANLASLELHTSLGRGPDPSQPTMVVFDLDPGPPAGMVECCQVALKLRKVFDRLGLVARPKTSGSKGLQVYVPVNQPIDYDRTRAFALSVGQLLERVDPEFVTTNMNKELRPGRVFIDWSQNHLTKTTVCVYSLRAKQQPTVSTPVTWDEVSNAADHTGEGDPLRFVASEVISRVQQHGDLFAEVLTVEQGLPVLS